MVVAATSFVVPPPPTAGCRAPFRRARCLPVDRGATEAARGGDAPPPLRLAVAAVTELLRAASPKNRREMIGGSGEREGGDAEGMIYRCADDVVAALRVDYGRAYFLTGNFNSDIYTGDCLFEDPTICFRGREQYSRNLDLLVPFFHQPSLTLENIEKVVNGDQELISAKWKLRTYLKLPWRPLISVGGMTKYELNENFKIVRHSESWDISALEAIGQMLTPSQRN